MPRYRVEVVETREVRCIYEVVAGSSHKARNKAGDGDTVKEEYANTYEVTSRVVVAEPQRLSGV